MGQGRDVYRNYTYVAFGLGIDLVIVLVALLGDEILVAVVLVPVLALGLRWAMIRVVLDGRGVRVVNLWRTHRLAWHEVASFVIDQRNRGRWHGMGRRRAFLGLVSVRCVDGREIPMSATSASATMTPSERVDDTWLPALVERFNRSRPARPR